MIEFGTMLAGMQMNVGLPYLQGSSSSQTTEGGADAFSAVFDRAASKTQNPPCEVKGHESDLDDDTDVDEKTPDELAALAGAYIIQNPQTDNIDASADMTDGEVVSILEGNTDIGASELEIPPEADGGDIAIPEAGVDTGEELTARMPQQQPEQVQAEDKTQAAAGDEIAAESDGPCPLENANDTAKNEAATQEGEQQQDSDDSRLFGTSQTVDISPERLAATETLNAAADAAPVTATPETLFSTMIENIATSASAESQYMEIQLKPDFLGKVSIQLSLTDAGLDIKIKADDPNVKNLIAGQIAQLSETLSDKGVNVTDIDVIYNDMTENTYNNPSGSSDGGGQADTPHTSRKAAEVNLGFGLGFTEEADTVSVLDTGISSVEYRA